MMALCSQGVSPPITSYRMEVCCCCTSPLGFTCQGHTGECERHSSMFHPCICSGTRGLLGVQILRLVGSLRASVPLCRSRDSVFWHWAGKEHG